MRIALGIEYNGSNYCGWQRQKANPSIQEQVELALSRVANHTVDVICAGRTDTGVHATNQVIHFDAKAERDERSWVLGCNSNLPDDISVLWAKPVDDTFHARFCAQTRSYRYIILNRYTKPALVGRNVTWCRRQLNHELMTEAARCLVGEHDFSSYRALHCQSKSPTRTVYELKIERHHQYVYLDITANGFLYHMVRNIAGVLISIGQGDNPTVWAKEILHKYDRTQGGVTAPPYGLYLTSVKYPKEFSLPKPQTKPSFV